MNSPLQVTPDQVRSFTLGRQLLLEPAPKPEDVIDRLIVVQIQYAANFPQCLWARCPKTKLGWAEDNLMKHRTVVKTWCVRSTVHALLVKDYPMMIGAFVFYRVAPTERYFVRTGILTAEELVAIEAQILEELEQGPLSRPELHRRVPALAKIPGIGWGRDVKGLAYQGKVVFAGSEGAFPIFARTDRWIKDSNLELMEPREAIRELLRRYLDGYGAATIKDFRHWTGLSAVEVATAFKDLDAELIKVDGSGRDPLYILAHHEEALLAEPEFPRVKLLPKFDSLVMGFRDKGRFMQAKDFAKVFRIAAQVEASVLIRNSLVATWRVTTKGPKALVTVEPFDKLGIRDRAAIEKEAAKLGRFLNAKDTQIIYV